MNQFLKYKQPDGSFADEELSYKNEREFVIEGIFGWCGCGNADAAGQYIMAVLRRIKQRSDYDNNNESTYEITKAHDKALQPFQGALEIMWYLMDRAELTEHGGSVPGWLLPRGEDVLELLEIYYKDSEDPAYAPISTSPTSP